MADKPLTLLQAAFMEAVSPTPAGRPPRVASVPVAAHDCLHAAVVVHRDQRVWYPCRSHEGGVHHFAARWPACPTAWCRLRPEPGHLHDIPSGTVELHDAIGGEQLMDPSVSVLLMLLSRFRVGGLDYETQKPTEPVQVTCAHCGRISQWFTFRDDGGAERTAVLRDLVEWAQAHKCLRNVGG